MKSKAAKAALGMAVGIAASMQSSEMAAQSAKDLQNAQQAYEGAGNFYTIGKTPMNAAQKKKRKKAMAGRKANRNRLSRR